MGDTETSKPTMMMLPAAPGTCCMCAMAHGEHDPHNYWSVFYGVRFKLKHGRDATHADVVAHLSEEIQQLYREALAEAGRPWREPPEGVEPIAEPYAESQPLRT